MRDKSFQMMKGRKTVDLGSLRPWRGSKPRNELNAVGKRSR